MLARSRSNVTEVAFNFTMSNTDDNSTPLYTDTQVLDRMADYLEYTIKDHEREIVRLQAKVEEASNQLANLNSWRKATK